MMHAIEFYGSAIFVSVLIVACLYKAGLYD
jgi:hypothetical protein